MKLNKLFVAVSLFLITQSLNAQNVSLYCETAAPYYVRNTVNNRNYDIANCWAFVALSYSSGSSQRITGSFVLRSNSPASFDPGSCWVKSPWLKPGSGNITFKMKFEEARPATIRRIIISYCAYDANSLTEYKEGSQILFDSISYEPNLPTTAQTVSFAIPAAIANSNQPYKFRISFVGAGGTSRYNVDDIVIPGTYWSDPSNSCLPIPTIVDADSDGVADADDAYPNDASRAYNNYYPAAGKGTLMFEDLWPTVGDYDFNDYVASYRYNLVTNANNKVVEMKLTLTTRAIGASFKNGLGIQLDNIDPISITSVTGSQTHNAAWVSTEANGTESGQTYANIIVFDDAFKILPSPGGSGVNVDPANPYAAPVDQNITISFSTVSDIAVTLQDVRFNPYLIVNQERGKEIHLPDMVPTDKADKKLFGTGQDDSNPEGGLMKSMVVSNKYYKTKNNLPWALQIEAEIPYPKTKIDLLQAYKNFANWAESSGSSNTDWYLDLPNYRDNTKLYITP